MRRLQRMIENAMVDPREQYMNTRIQQLEEEREKCHNDMDKAWFTRIIQELEWVQQMKGKPTHNCYMEGRKQA